MSTSRHLNKICVAAVALSLVLTILLMNGEALGITPAAGSIGYEDRIFDTQTVHSIDIVMEDWDSFIETCENEEYSPCAVVIDSESYKNVGIRAKGNTSLSSVRSMDSSRYSFKLEFDQYEDGKTYHGLDKLSLNNLIQDNTMMKDYLVYRMMGDFGVDAPLCSYAYITVNGEDWGLYLAVEGVEDSFLSRNYGADSGELYKPDSMGFGGGRGNGRDFRPDDFDFGDADGQNLTKNASENESGKESGIGETSGETNPNTENAVLESGQAAEEVSESTKQTPEGMGELPEGMSQPPEGMEELPEGMSQPPEGMGELPEGMSQPPEGMGELPEGMNQPPQKPAGEDSGFSGKPDGGMGSDDVKLKYIDDNPDSYNNIFDNAKTNITDADRQRLISALKRLSEYTDLENTVDIEEVLRYFVVHNFVCNGDSYTGAMIHNYYLYEKDGKLSMIPWDYNLAFGTFQGGNANSFVNASIDSPVSGGSADDRSMLGWIFSDEGCTQKYHTYFSEFVGRWFSDGQLAQMVKDTQELLKPYVEKDPTKFCTSEEFADGVQALEKFVTLRAEAVRRQLAGDTQTVDTTGLDLSAMGCMDDTMGKDPDGKERGGAFHPQF